MSDSVDTKPNHRWLIPDTWSWTVASEIAQIIGGRTPSTTDPQNFDGGEIPWITPADLTGYREKMIRRGERNITEKGLSESGARVVPAGTVLFSSRAPIGYVAIADNAVTTSQGFKSFIPSQAVTSDYLYYYMQFAKPIAKEMANGTIFLEISGAKAAQIPIPVAPLAEQKQIVAEIEKQFTRLDAATAVLKRVQTNLKRYRASVLKAACEGRPIPNTSDTDGYPTSPVLSLLAQPLANVRSPQSTRDGFKILRLTAMRDGIIDMNEWRRGQVTESWIENLSIKQGDILVSRGNGSKALVGLAGLVGDTSMESEPILFPDTMIRIRLNAAVCDSRFFVMIWNSRIVRDQIESTARTTAGIHKIAQPDIERFEIPLPSLKDQLEIVAVAEKLLTTLRHTTLALEMLTSRSSSLRASILSAAFTGQLVPQNPSDQPASVLLERIRAERKVPGTQKPARRSRKEPLHA